MQMNPQETMLRAMRDQANFESTIAQVRRIQQKQRSESGPSLFWIAVIVWLLALFFRRRAKIARNPSGGQQ